MSEITLKEIICAYLKANRFDGLFNDDGDCACELRDLMICDEPGTNCRPGFKTVCDCPDGHLFHIVENRFIALKDFHKEVCRRAEEKIIITGKLEGAHYAAMSEIMKELELLKP